ncbi:TPA: 50S ribosomal protein L10 [Candidatus Woesearchaeota archaeon]|nr:50S ribosomal protein L10 [archaeon]HIJ11707.1 50S ribosomal protein L10 [Candidatus Woesearchaeota archaeon]|tara:strand:- start:296 stop:1135 length:840 start_codon:yes stop_codon:yes gene_type:complete
MVSQQKQDLVQGIVDKVKKAPIVGVLNMESLPAQQLQKMREMLREKGVEIVMARKKLLVLALEKSGKEHIKELAAKIKGMPALLFSDDNPFGVYALIQKNKSEAPAKAGQIAPKEIVVKGGATNFAPGPIISELAAVGIKTKVDNGKLAIISDVTVAKEGDEISAALAETLKRLDIKPMELGLDLVAVWESGTVFNAKDLHIDEEEYRNNFTQAAQWAFNLAVEAGIFTSETSELLVSKAFREAKAVAVEAAYMTEETRDDILAKSEREASSVKSEANL